MFSMEMENACESAAKAAQSGVNLRPERSWKKVLHSPKMRKIMQHGKIKKQGVVTNSAEETIEFAKSFAKTLKAGDVIALHGDLGSGKTTFIKGLALGLGLKNPDEVKSPTFALMHLYKTHPPLYHFDLYRLESLKEIINIGFEEYVQDPGLIVCVEWAERAEDLLPETKRDVSLSVAGPSQRKIEITGSPGQAGG